MTIQSKPANNNYRQGYERTFKQCSLPFTNRKTKYTTSDVQEPPKKPSPSPDAKCRTAYTQPALV